MKAAIYARVSPTRKEQGEYIAKSIQNQLDKCNKQISVDDNEFYKSYVDQYISGKSQEYMKDFLKMIIDAKEKKFDKIYCLRVDRFGRNLQQMINTQKELQKINIHLKFVEQSLDTANTFGRMVMGIMASVAEWQRETIIDNTRIGRDIAYKNNPEKFGRPKAKINWKQVENFLAVTDKDTGKFVYSWSEIAKTIGVTTSTLLRRYRKEKGKIAARRI